MVGVIHESWVKDRIQELCTGGICHGSWGFLELFTRKEFRRVTSKGLSGDKVG